MREKITVISKDNKSYDNIKTLLEANSFECSYAEYGEGFDSDSSFSGDMPSLFIIELENAEAFELMKTMSAHEKASAVPSVFICEYPEAFIAMGDLADKASVVRKSDDNAELDSYIRKLFKLSSAHFEEFEAGINSHINHFSYQLIKSMSLSYEMRDFYFKGHSRRSASYAKEIMKRLGGSEDEQLKIYCAGLVHDVGMISIPDAIIAANSSISEDEYDRIKEHCSVGAKLFNTLSEIPELAEGARWHHERYDGTGYPDKLAGEDIPLCARILAVADAYDAMTSDRRYRNAMPQQQVREEIVKGIGTQFDPAIAKIMLEMIAEDKNYEKRQVSKKEWNVLIVDDDPMMIKMEEFILSRFKQYHVFKANSGKAALKLLKEENEIDLIILDVEMPMMDGIETLIRIRNNELLSSIPVVFVTADNTKNTIEKAVKYGVNGYVTKPFTPHFFMKRINEALNKL